MPAAADRAPAFKNGGFIAERRELRTLPCHEVACTTVELVRTRVRVAEGARAAKGPVAERGVLTAHDEVWDTAVRQAEVIGPLAEKARVGPADADEAAATLGISRRQVYVLLALWRAGEGMVSDLLPGRSSGSRGGGPLPDEAETTACAGAAQAVPDAGAPDRCGRPPGDRASVPDAGLRVPSRGTVVRRVARPEPIFSTAAREGKEAARRSRPVRGRAARGHHVAPVTTRYAIAEIGRRRPSCGSGAAIRFLLSGL